MQSQRVFPYDNDCDETDCEESMNVHIREAPPAVVNAISTVPSGSFGDGRAIIGALAFMESASDRDMGINELLSWFDEFLVRPGYLSTRPSRVFESAESVYLGSLDSGSSLKVRNQRLKKVLQTARKRVVKTLSGLIKTPADDDFLFMLAATGRIWPNRSGEVERSWIIGPHPDDAISEIVLALFGADALSNRQMYAQNLCICSTCSRICFRESPRRRDRCRIHEAGSVRNIFRLFK